MDRNQLLSLYKSMFTAREVDRVEQELTRRGESFFHVSGAGHEAPAVLARHLTKHDWLHLHYRDKALMIARGVTPRKFFDASLCNDTSHSRGRQMCAQMSDADLHILSLGGPVGNAALQAVGVAAATKEKKHTPITIYCIGDGSTQEGEFLEGVAEAVRLQVPLLIVIQDNQWAISTETRGQTFFSLPDGDADSFYGLPIHRVDGRDIVASDAALGDLVQQMRESRGPALVLLQTERLSNHTNADDQSIYRPTEDIRAAQNERDPLVRFEQQLLERGITEAELAAIRETVVAEVAADENDAIYAAQPSATHEAKKPLQVELTHPSREHRGDREADGQLTMKDAMRSVLRDRLATDDRVFLYGQDIEDPKGDVFGVTRGLSTAYPGRVCNAPLSESTILGNSIGRALVGQRPVAFIQFADFLPLAYNQLTSELGSMYWRTNGTWESPVIVMVPCGGYRPGLGPFHSHSFESVCAHIPGVDVYMPSTAGDAAGMLNAAFESGRPSVFFYPKALLNDPSQSTSPDTAKQFTPIGVARKVRAGRDITLVGWGNTVSLCEKSATALEQAGIEAEVIDLRSLSPWDEATVLASAEKTARLIVVHEDNHTCGIGGEVVATIAEKTRVPVAMRRVTRADTLIPCNFANQIEVLPSFKRVLSTAAELLNMDLEWIAPKELEVGMAEIEAIGSGPSDENVLLVELNIKPGQQVSRGDVVASLEATKSVFDLTSQIDGTIEEIFVAEGDTVPVGDVIASVRCATDNKRPKPVTTENPGTPVLRRRVTDPNRLLVPRQTIERRPFDVGISGVATVQGSRLITNEELVEGKSMSPEDIMRRTGIQFRHWVQGSETAQSMASQACWEILDREGLIVDDIDLVICATTSPSFVTPSMACQVLHQLTGGASEAMIQAYDISAACSGYLYALQAGYDFLQSKPHARVLIVTAEVLSPLLDLGDLDTAILFGDASSATVLYGEDHFGRSKARLHRPELSARADDGSTLSVPSQNNGFIKMKGRKVFAEAVRAMIGSLTRVCDQQGYGVDNLDLIVPHQANQRIIDAIQSRVSSSVFSNIREHGNTSSTSIPLCLSEVLPKMKSGERFGMCAYGGGVTFGAGILEKN
ncbi:2-oxoisovalerate dehydrogenase subunit beta [Rosistilla carotiformis]|uniref:3-methyl-2-oxobutanoate dehydrogenase (2-methylpropanoyl-transferring) n=1 Tax=Rosistilla carotiformis TaxID=2528017 RepID=A0A518JPR9_9BACT|nr:beta-ketoacyl-ACP synthase 3 [Rosistilla carotiformis]QDV67518.1 2-oxoisovalerate dehydrogenase subunit beta [Rosistilla carotiformis]